MNKIIKFLIISLLMIFPLSACSCNKEDNSQNNKVESLPKEVGRYTFNNAILRVDGSVKNTTCKGELGDEELVECSSLIAQNIELTKDGHINLISTIDMQPGDSMVFAIGLYTIEENGNIKVRNGNDTPDFDDVYNGKLSYNDGVITATLVELGKIIIFNKIN